MSTESCTEWTMIAAACNERTKDEIKKCIPQVTYLDCRRVADGKLHLLPAHCVKILVLGAPAVGKSTLLMNYFYECDGPTMPVATYYNNCEVHMQYTEENGVDVQVYFCDVSGAENFHQLDEAIYRDTSVIIYCYSINNLRSLSDLINSWIPLSRIFIGNIPSILVGNMIDMRDNNEFSDIILITTEVGESVKDSCGVNRFYECSIEDGDTPQEIFQTALRLALHIES